MSDATVTTNSASTEQAAEYEQPSTLDKGKGKARAIEPEEDDEEDEDDDEEDEEDDYNIDDDELAELIEDDEELAEIDTSNIVWTGRRRNAPLDYSSEEALKQAGLDSGAPAGEQEEDDAEFHGEEMNDE
ncbi:Histone chaperone domain CHZ [Kalmanozyma brasiliensis GHG001]|uniref:Histone chaperone domain-containing protein n=1 Tax=Kalmanozyma brasiliensis (strain GHG001) TaxID=1365824 RepID=V5ER26_KALBG|nr:Histone chaperone domain CHZ [Kalmanozyma brasiliensis GHG001]EST07560.1 Histone chaperone domain CHZ [Kalmanozyma brasiliensis GHG001]